MKFYRAITFIICLCLIISVPAFAKTGEVFSDVDTDAWYYDEVMSAYDRGIMVGMSQDSFAPDKTVTREMFVTALSRIAMTSVNQYHEPSSVFDDVDVDKWYADAIEWAASSGIVYGVSENKFGVGQAVTREQIAAFTARFITTYLYAIDNVKSPAAPFNDKCSDYAKDSIEFMRKTGLISGRGKGKFAPHDTATRAEVAAILVRVSDAIKDPVFRFDFDADNVSQVGVFCDVYTKNHIVTDRDEVKDFIKYLNDTPIERAEYIGEAVGWDHKISLYDKGGDRLFTVYFTRSFFIINDCLYIVEGDYFDPVVDAIK